MLLNEFLILISLFAHYYFEITAYLPLYVNTCSTVNELLHYLEMSFTTSQEESSRTLLLTSAVQTNV